MILLNGDPINITNFPDGTSQVWKIDEKHLIKEKATVDWEFSHEGEFMQLAQLKTLLDLTVPYVKLNIKFLPYGRQDKSVANDATFALHTFASLLNTLNFNVVIILDPHSKEAALLINNAFSIYPQRELRHAVSETGCGMVFYPDSGAVVKYKDRYSLYLPWGYGQKVRDQATGRITNYEVFGDVDGKKILIIDDICDGGATFELLARELINNGAKEVNLFVTHGLFSRGLEHLREAGIGRIFTGNGEVKMGTGNP